ncbi:hypothetical protein [Microbulbifer sp. S227A]|uniref:hypothetical protein n=1 Tax=Microbulbifer sp. S227A TaxID=3415131 RepID=UPI003C7C15CE
MNMIVSALALGVAAGSGAGYVLASGQGNPSRPHQHDAPHHAHVHAHHETIELPAGQAPTIVLSVLRDPGQGWNLHVQTTNFAFAPAASGAAHVVGEGHGHIYVNGQKLGRLYGNWFHLAELPAGQVQIRVGLFSNDHKSLAVDGRAVADSITLNTSRDRSG